MRRPQENSYAICELGLKKESKSQKRKFNGMKMIFVFLREIWDSRNECSDCRSRPCLQTLKGNTNKWAAQMQWQKMQNITSQIDGNRSARTCEAVPGVLNSDPIDPSARPRVHSAAIMAVRGAAPRGTQTWLSRNRNWLRSVTASTSKIHTVIEIYMI